MAKNRTPDSYADRVALSQLAEQHLRALCSYTDRSLGTAGNEDATRYFAGVAEAAGWSVSVSRLDCLRWERSGANLSLGHRAFGLHAGPYSLPADVEAPLQVVSTLKDLQEIDAKGRILLLTGELVREQLFPRGFPFYFPEEHEAVYAALDRARPAAVIAATGRNPEVAGGLYPFPLIEDGSFPFPSAYMTDEMGEVVAEAVASASSPVVHLRIDSDRVPAAAEQIEAALGLPTERRIVISGHIDSKEGAPGAIDNAAGVVVLLLLARLLSQYEGECGLELVPFNGEDYYAVPGQLDWFRRNEGALGNIDLLINIDGAGYYDGETDYSLYQLDDATAAAVRRAFRAAGKDGAGGFVEGEPWYQGDHAMFVQRGIPAVAVTSAQIWELSESTTHTSRDVPEIVDPARLARIALALRDVITAIP